jgi:hypothetical protein
MKIDRFDVYLRNYRNKGSMFLGTIPERREESRGESMVDLRGGIAYARGVFGGVVLDPIAIFVIPRTANDGREGGI